MFNNRNQRLKFTPVNGDAVRLRCRVSLYEGRGEFQLIVEHLEPAGAGALQAAFEKLKARLLAEGLFDPARKQALPPSASQRGRFAGGFVGFQRGGSGARHCRQRAAHCQRRGA